MVGNRRPSVENGFMALCMTLFSTGEFSGRPMAFFSAYFDESGTHDSSPVLSVCGAVAPVEQWERFNVEWRCCLAKFGLREPFHMKDYCHSRGQFEPWRNEHALRNELMRQLVGIFGRRIQRTFSANLVSSDYREIISADDFAKRYFGTPYAAAVYTCIHLMSGWAKEYGYVERIPCGFDRGHKNSSEVSRIVGRYLEDDRLQHHIIGSLVFDEDDNHPPLQAADMFAWEVQRHFSDQVHQIKRAPRSSFLGLGKVPTLAVLLNRERLIDMKTIARERSDLKSLAVTRRYDRG